MSADELALKWKHFMECVDIDEFEITLQRMKLEELDYVVSSCQSIINGLDEMLSKEMETKKEIIITKPRVKSGDGTDISKTDGSDLEWYQTLKAITVDSYGLLITDLDLNEMEAVMNKHKNLISAVKKAWMTKKKSPALSTLNASEIFMEQCTKLVTFTFRGYFGESYAKKWGFFIENAMSIIISHYGDWVDYPEGDHILEDHKGHVYVALITPDCRNLYTCDSSSPGAIIHWDLTTNRIIYQWSAPATHIQALAWHRGLLASGGYRSRNIALSNGYTHELLHQFVGHTGGILSLQFDQSGDTLVSASYDGTVREFSVVTGDALRLYTGHTNLTLVARYMDDIIISGSFDGSLKKWNPKNLKNTDSVYDGSPRSFSVSVDGSLLAVGLDGSAIVYQWPAMEHANVFDDCRSVVAFHPIHSRLLAVGKKDNSIQVWNVETSELIKTFHGHTKKPRGMNFTPDGIKLISVGEDSSVRIWDCSKLVEE